MGQFPGSVCGGGAERVHVRGVAIVAASRLRSVSGASGAADSVRLSDRPRLAHAGAADGGVTIGGKLTRTRSVRLVAEHGQYTGGRKMPISTRYVFIVSMDVTPEKEV